MGPRNNYHPTQFCVRPLSASLSSLLSFPLCFLIRRPLCNFSFSFASIKVPFSSFLSLPVILQSITSQSISLSVVAEAKKKRETMTIPSHGDDQVSAASRRLGRQLVFAYYVTGHGFGHATRVAEVCFFFFKVWNVFFFVLNFTTLRLTHIAILQMNFLKSCFFHAHHDHDHDPADVVIIRYKFKSSVGSPFTWFAAWSSGVSPPLIVKIGFKFRFF